MLKATRLLLVRVAANHPSVRKEPWLYVYDEDKISTRVSIQENFSPHNAPQRQDRDVGRGVRFGLQAASHRP